jgi:hypothetical protein
MRISVMGHRVAQELGGDLNAVVTIDVLGREELIVVLCEIGGVRPSRGAGASTEEDNGAIVKSGGRWVPSTDSHTDALHSRK